MKSLLRSNEFGYVLDDFFRAISDQHASRAYHVSNLDDGRRLLQIPAPGLKKSDFKVSYVDKTLRVSADIKEHLYVRSFDYEFNVGHLDASLIEALYENGVLLIKLPCKEKTNVVTVEVK